IPNLKLIDLSMFFSENETSYLMGVPRGGKTLDSIKLNKFIVLIVGSESEGPAEYFNILPHLKITIPMYGRAESLNVAVAASIMLYKISSLINSP
ncbi:MAG: RNA methyltransferase, partial [Peptococcaceae bacterium]|nr:RNA methyltransferase [Peptococcaceae bacterium]